MPKRRKKKVSQLPEIKVPKLPSVAELLGVRTRLFDTKHKTTTKLGKREYQRLYMKAYRDRTRKRKYSPRRKRRKKKRS